MKIVLTQFAINSHFDSTRPGTVIGDNTPEQFEQKVNNAILPEYAWKNDLQWRNGYAPFCKLLFIKNWTDARTGTLAITPGNRNSLKSAYKVRVLPELPVLVRWLELSPKKIPLAEFLGLVLYDKEQLEKEGTSIDADYGIVAILGQMHNQEEPMTPMTAMRNALGFDEGGSAVPINREAYLRSVEFWNAHAAVSSTKDSSSSF